MTADTESDTDVGEDDAVADLQYDLIEEEPVTTTADDKFGHAEYVHSLQNIIESASRQQHIALYGPWGSGKTSVVKMLFREHLGWTSDEDSESTEETTAELDETTATNDDPGNESEEIVPVYFNAWRHAEGSIRTDLLLTVTDELKRQSGYSPPSATERWFGLIPYFGSDPDTQLRSQTGIKRYLYDEVDREKQEEGAVTQALHSFPRFISNSPVTAALFIVLAVAIYLTLPLFMSSGNLVRAGLAGLIAAAVPLMKAASQLDAIGRNATTFREGPRHAWPGAYETLFTDQIEAITNDPELDAERIVIAIDDLDRCESDVVNDVLVSLKTFMEHDDCTYILPCEEAALRSHVSGLGEGEYFESETNQQSYLEKFIDVEVGIPAFQQDDIARYAKERNESLREPLDTETLEILSEADQATPRQAIRSINRVQTTRNIAHELETETETNPPVLRPGTITDKPRFIAKVLILEQRFPDFYRRVRDDPSLYELVSHYYRSDQQTPPREVSRLFNELGVSFDHGDGLDAFLQRWSHVDASDPRPFLQIGQPVGEFTAQGRFAQLITEGSYDEAREMIEQAVALNNSERVQGFVDLLRANLYRHPEARLRGGTYSESDSEDECEDERSIESLRAAGLTPSITVGTESYLPDEEPNDQSLAERIQAIVELSDAFADVELGEDATGSDADTVGREVVVELTLDIWQQFDGDEPLCPELSFTPLAALLGRTSDTLAIQEDEAPTSEDLAVWTTPDVRKLLTLYLCATFEQNAATTGQFTVDSAQLRSLATSPAFEDLDVLSRDWLTRLAALLPLTEEATDIVLRAGVLNDELPADKYLQELLLSELDREIERFAQQDVAYHESRLATLIDYYQQIDEQATPQNRSEFVSLILELCEQMQTPVTPNMLSLPEEWPAGLEHVYELRASSVETDDTRVRTPIEEDLLNRLDSVIEQFVAAIEANRSESIDYRYFRLLVYLAKVSSDVDFRGSNERRTAHPDRRRCYTLIETLTQQGATNQNKKAVRELFRSIRRGHFFLHIPGNDLCMSRLSDLKTAADEVASTEGILPEETYTDTVRILSQRHDSTESLPGLCFDVEHDYERVGLETEWVSKALLESVRASDEAGREDLLEEILQYAPKRRELAIETFNRLTASEEGVRNVAYNSLYATIYEELDKNTGTECPPVIHFELLLHSFRKVNPTMMTAFSDQYQEILTSELTTTEVRSELIRYLPYVVAGLLQRGAFETSWLKSLYAELKEMDELATEREPTNTTESEQRLRTEINRALTRLQGILSSTEHYTPPISEIPATEMEPEDIEWTSEYPEELIEEVSRR